MQAGPRAMRVLLFLFNDTATTEIYALSLHDALPIWFTPAVQTQETTLPSSGDSVPESVNTNFSDYMRDQQRVASDNDGQTYVVNSNADPNQMTDTRDGVSGFTQAAPGSDAAGYGEVAPSGATTVDT